MKHLILVAGSGRSGTSIMAGALGRLGYHVPQPEVEANETNPKGFAEPRWVVDFHARLLKKAVVRVADADPHAGERIAPVLEDPETIDELRTWLAGELAGSDRVVVKDPRLLWFLPLWESVGSELGATVGVVTMLRHPAEVVRSRMSWYSHVVDSPAGELAGWINTMLEAELRTRHLRRCYVEFTAFQDDWFAQLERVGAALETPDLVAIAAERREHVEELFDHSLHRSKGSWDDLHVLPELVELAVGVWQDLVAQAAATAPQDLGRFDERRASYAALIQQVEAVARPALDAELRRTKGELNGQRRAAAVLERRLQRKQEQLEHLRERVRRAEASAGDSAPATTRRRSLVRAGIRRTPAPLRRIVPRAARERVLRKL